MRVKMGLKKFFSLPKKIKRFGDAQEGATAIEFAIIGAPFFLLIFAIIETSIFFFAGQFMEASVDKALRKFRTGEYNSTTSESQFRSEFCAEILILFPNCSNEVQTELQIAGSFGGLTDPSGPDGSGNLPGNAFGNSGVGPGATQVIQLSAQAKWPVFTNFAAPLLHTPGGNFALIQVIAVARTEPFE